MTGQTDIDNAITLIGNTTIDIDANATISGNISDGDNGFGITKTGTETLILSGTNRFTGSTSIQTGTLELSNGTAIADSSAITVAADATLQLNSDEAMGSISGRGTINIQDNDITIYQSTDTTFSGQINGSGQLLKQGDGDLILTGNNSFTGGTMLSSGTVTLGANNSLGSGAITLVEGTTVNLSTGTLNNALIITGDVTFNNENNTTLSGTISGDHDLVKSGTGILTLNGNNDYTGTTTVSGGTLKITDGSNLGHGNLILGEDSTLDVSGGSITQAITLTGNSTIQTEDTVTISGTISGDDHAGLTSSGNGTLILTGSNNDTGSITVSSGTLITTSGSGIGDNRSVTIAAGATLQLDTEETIGNLSGDGTLNIKDNSLIINQNSNSTFAGQITGSGSWTKQGQGILELTGQNHVSGDITVSGGTLKLNNNEGNALVDTSSVTLNSGATLLLANDETIASISGQGNLDLDHHILTLNDNTDTTLSGSISGNGTLNKQGSGTLTLNGDNSASDFGITLNDGTLTLTNDNNLGSGNLNLSGGNLTLNETSTINNAINISNASTLTINADTTLAGQLTESSEKSLFELGRVS
ncbi:autotransporter-associated beta strand repeat-containing protein [Magnetococcales bacterium HHB-1]